MTITVVELSVPCTCICITRKVRELRLKHGMVDDCSKPCCYVKYRPSRICMAVTDSCMASGKGQGRGDETVQYCIVSFPDSSLG